MAFVKPQSNCAAMILSCGLPTLEMTLQSAIRYLPMDLPIYLFDDTTASDQDPLHRRWWIDKCMKPFVNRVTRIFLDEYRHDWATARFCERHPQYDFVLKLDDDVFLTNAEFWPGIIAAYNSRSDTGIACAFQPIQRYTLPIMAKRLNKILPECLLVNDVRHELDQSPDLAHHIWDMTTPPSIILNDLRKAQPRFIYIDHKVMPSMHFTICHMFIAAQDAVGFLQEPIFKRGEEHWVHIMRTKHHRPVAVDTHNLVYHYGYRKEKKYSDEHILPKLRGMEFWEHLKPSNYVEPPGLEHQ